MEVETFDLFPDSLFHWGSQSQILLRIFLLLLMLVYLSRYFHLHRLGSKTGWSMSSRMDGRRRGGRLHQFSRAMNDWMNLLHYFLAFMYSQKGG